MSYEVRQTVDYAFGTLTAGAAISDLTLTSADFSAKIPSGLSTTDYVPIALQNPSTGSFEIVWATAHSGTSATVTVARGKEGTSAQAWPSNTLWTVAATRRDGVLPVSTRTALPTDPHAGLRCLIMDEEVIVEWSVSIGWFTPVKTLAGRSITHTGLLASAVGSGETDMPKFAVTGVHTKNGFFYEFSLALSAQFSESGDEFGVRIRKDNPVGSGGTVIQEYRWNAVATAFNTDTRTFTGVWKATADNASTNFYVSIVNLAGSGTVDVNGNANSYRPSFVITDRGSDPSVWSEVA